MDGDIGGIEKAQFHTYSRPQQQMWDGIQTWWDRLEWTSAESNTAAISGVGIAITEI